MVFFTTASCNWDKCIISFLNYPQLHAITIKFMITWFPLYNKVFVNFFLTYCAYGVFYRCVFVLFWVVCNKLFPKPYYHSFPFHLKLQKYDMSILLLFPVSKRVYNIALITSSAPFLLPQQRNIFVFKNLATKYPFFISACTLNFI